MQPPLSAPQRKYLKGLAHKLKPVVIVGQQGITENLIQSVDAALERHELIKIRFNEYKEKEEKERLTRRIAERTAAHWVGTIGHIVICYRPQADPEKRRIRLPAG